MGIIQPNIELYLPFESTLPSLGTDASGNGNHGTVHGVTQGVGKIGGAGVFDGVNDYIDLGTTGWVSNIQSPFTISFWIQPNNVTTNQLIFSSRNSITESFYIQLLAGILRFYINNGTQIYKDYTAPAISQWTHVVITYDKNLVSDNLKYYYNGVNVASFNMTLALAGTDRITNIGKNSLTNRYYLNGLLSKVKIFNTALSEQNVAREMIGLPAII